MECVFFNSYGISECMKKLEQASASNATITRFVALRVL